jgi:hypothetical protein
MNTTEGFPATSFRPRSRWQRLAPAFTLLILAPVVAEVLSGATRLSFIFVLIPEIMVWGCGALIAREAVRRWRAGWTSLLLLGLALSVAEEFIIQQTSLAPLPWLASAQSFGRVWGVNWLYFLYMLCYESVWVVLVPVQLTELLFPDRRHEPWLRQGGLIISIFVFVFGSFIAWFTWTQQARPNVFHVPKYTPPFSTILLGLLAIALIIFGAYAIRRAPQLPPDTSRNAPQPWLVVLAILLLGYPWYLLISMVFAPTITRGLPFWLPMIVGIAWANAAYLILKRWSSACGWRDIHRWALVFGTLLVSMTAGFLGSSTWPRMDIIAKTILNVIAFLCLLALARSISRRESPPLD